MNQIADERMMEVVNNPEAFGLDGCTLCKGPRVAVGFTPVKEGGRIFYALCQEHYENPDVIRLVDEYIAKEMAG
jgi:hypothetical protein